MSIKEIIQYFQIDDSIDISQNEIYKDLLTSFRILESYALKQFPRLHDSYENKHIYQLVIDQDIPLFFSSYGWEQNETAQGTQLFINDTIALFLTRILFFRLLADMKLLQLPRNNHHYFDPSQIFQYISPKVHNMVIREIHDLNSQLFSRLEALLFNFSDTKMHPDVAKAINILNSLQVDLIDEKVLGELYQSILNVDKRKITGEYYTPCSIVKYILKQTVFKSAKEGLILDPCCGFGTFLIEAFKFYSMSQINIYGNKQLLNFSKRLVGFEINPFSSTLTLFQLIWTLLKHKIKAIDDDTVNIYTFDSLIKGSVEPLLDVLDVRDNQKYQYVLGNPPYVRAERLKNGESLGNLWNGIWGQNCDTAILFLYRALTEWLSDGGELGVVVSGGIANSQSAQPLRNLFEKSVTIKEIVWLEFAPKVWEASAIPMIIIVEKKQPNPQDVIKIASPHQWPDNNISFKEFSYKQFFSSKVNPEKYLLPLLNIDDINILDRLSCFGNVGQVVQFKYGVQRGGKAKLTDTPIGKRSIKVIDGKSISMARYGEPIGWVDLNTVQKCSIWRQYKLGDHQQSIAECCENEESGYIALPGITLAPTAAYIPDSNIACLDTTVVGSCPDRQMLKALAAYFNSKICQYICLIQLRAGIMQGSHRLHMYPRTVHKLPWPHKISHTLVSDLAQLYDQLSSSAKLTCITNKNEIEEFKNIRTLIDKKVGSLFSLSSLDLEHIDRQLSLPPLDKLTPRFPWNETKPSRPNRYDFDRFKTIL